MKASEMTNEELATQIEVYNTVLGCSCSKCEYMREAAARLRKVTVRTDNSAVIAELQRRVEKQKEINKELVDENAALLAKLKVAEDALDSAWMYADKLPHQWPLPERVRTKMKDALSAIREEGGAQ